MNRLELLRKGLEGRDISPIKHCSIYGCFNTPEFRQDRSDGVVDLLCLGHTLVRLEERDHLGVDKDKLNARAGTYVEARGRF